MDPSGVSGSGLTATGLFCGSCGTELAPKSKFCNECGAPVTQVSRSAEYKQVTVLFADVVHSMDIAATVGTERLREIMAELVNITTAVVKRYGGTVDKFTGDGIMAVFGAPLALEDHAVRACLAALEIQDGIAQLAAQVGDRDGVELALRIGLNSGQVIAGEVGSTSLGYTTIGEQVGMAQRMESAAPPGGVLLSESTARLVEHSTVLGEPELVHIKGSDSLVSARRLVATAAEGGRPVRQFATLVGRDWEMSTIVGLLDQSMTGKGRVVGLVGPAGIGKSRIVAEIMVTALDRGAEVFTTYCESHTKDISFHVGARFLRNVFEISNLGEDVARARVRSRLQDNDPDDLILLDDLLGIRDPGVPLPDIDPDARRRRVGAMLNAAGVARTTPAVFVIEDAHWIDETSEAMIADFGMVVPQTHSLVLVTYRPEYRGPLDWLPSSHRIALAPLDDSQSSALAEELLGNDGSITGLVAQITDRAAGNPFFVEEIVRDVVERGIVEGEPGAYVCRHDSSDISVPASLQATIAARIDRLGREAKRTLSAAAVIGLRFDSDLLANLVETVELTELIEAELLDQVTFAARREYAFRHPLIRSVAHDSQLRSDRSQLHRRLAAMIEQRNPDSPDENAPLIAEHLEAAGGLREAYDWHMRAATLADTRDVRAARASWQRARDIADRLPTDDPDRASRRIAPRVRLCASAWRVWADVADAGFEELNELCTEAGDPVSKAFGLSGLLVVLVFQDRFRDAARAATDLVRLVDSIGDSTLAALVGGASNSKLQGGEAREGLRMLEATFDFLGDDVSHEYFGMGSLVGVARALRGSCRYSLGIPGWRDDFDDGIAIARPVDPTSYAAALMFKYVFPVHNGALIPDAAAERASAGALELAENAIDDFALEAARLTRGLVLVYGDGPDRAVGYDLMNSYRDAQLRRNPSHKAARFVDTEIAREKARIGDLDAAIEVAHRSVDFLFDSGDMTSRGPAVTVLVESLLMRGGGGDLAEAEAAIERLASVPTDPGFVLHELPLLRLRALLARAHGDESAYRDYRDRYRAMATELGFEGHMKWAEAMP